MVQRAHDRGDVPTVMVRAPWFYGPYQPPRQSQFFRTIRRGRFPLVGDGTQRRSMAYTDNLVQGLLRAEVADKAPGNAYWVADARPTSCGRSSPPCAGRWRPRACPRPGRTLPAPGARPAWPSSWTGWPRPRRYLQPLHVLGELNHTIACDVSRARAELGYEPTVELEGHAGQHPLVPRPRGAALMARTVLITGGSGYFGSILAARPGRG